MRLPHRLQTQNGQKAVVDGIPFDLPVQSRNSPALMAAFPANYERARALLPGRELHPLKFRGKAILVVAVIDYRETSIGAYIEYSIGLGCTFGPKPVPLWQAALFRGHFGLGQYVVDLPVSSEISVKGGKGIWGMPKHQANLDFQIGDHSVRSRYDKDGEMVAEIEIDIPSQINFQLGASGTNWCAFRGMLMKSSIYFRGRGHFGLFGKANARFSLGDSARADVLRELQIGQDAMFTAFFPETNGTLDDHFESWFLTGERLPVAETEGMESVVDLGLGQDWLPPPGQPQPAAGRQAEAGEG